MKRKLVMSAAAEAMTAELMALSKEDQLEIMDFLLDSLPDPGPAPRRAPTAKRRTKGSTKTGKSKAVPKQVPGNRVPRTSSNKASS